MNARIFLLVVMVAIAQNSIAQRKIGSKISGQYATVFENPEYKPRTFKKILVQSGLTDSKTDDKIMKEFFDIDVIAVSALTLMPPIKEYTEDDKKKIYLENGIDGLVELRPKRRESGVLNDTGDFHLVLTDLSTQMIAVTYSGTATIGYMSAATDSNKAFVKFVRLVRNDLKKFVKP